MKVALGFSMMLMLSSCGSLKQRLGIASATSGTIAAGIDLGKIPVDCYKIEPHAPLYAGVEARTTIKLERIATNNANARTARCVQFIEDRDSRLKNTAGLN